MAEFRTILFILLIIAEIILAPSIPAYDQVPPLTWSFGSEARDGLISNLQDSRLTPQYVRMYEDMMGHNQQPKTIDGREDRIERSGLVKNDTSPHSSNETCPVRWRRRRRHIARGEPLEDYLRNSDRNETSKQPEPSPQPLNGSSADPSNMTTASVTLTTVQPASTTTSESISTTAYVTPTTVKPPAATIMPGVTSTIQPAWTSSSPPDTTRNSGGRHELTPPVQLIEETDDDE